QHRARSLVRLRAIGLRGPRLQKKGEAHGRTRKHFAHAWRDQRRARRNAETARARRTAGNVALVAERCLGRDGVRRSLQSNTRTLKTRKAWVTINKTVGPTLKEGVGEPAGSKEAAAKRRCTEAIRTVGPTLKERRRGSMLQFVMQHQFWFAVMLYWIYS